MTNSNPTIDYSIVVPVYFNQGSLWPTYKNLITEVFEKQSQREGQIIFVDDGSGDGSLDELLEIQHSDPRVVVVKLTRNFGQVSAIRAGMSTASGRCLVLMSADGQDPPELVREMLDIHYARGVDVVVAARCGRDESWFRRATSRMFYSIMRKLSFPQMPGGGFDFLLLGPRSLDHLRDCQEVSPFFQGQILWSGFSVQFIQYRRRNRDVGKSKWTIGKKLTYLLDGVLSYSFFPIRLTSALGVIVATLGFLYALLVTVKKLLYGHPIEGWTPLMVVILVMGGIQILIMGIFGEYLWRVFAQVLQRKPFIIDHIYSGHHPVTALSSKTGHQITNDNAVLGGRE